MKPTVISGGSGENPTSHHPTGNNPTANNIGSSGGVGSESNANAYANSRQFPQFQTGFDFEPDMDDIFSDAGLRSRLHRMRDPFTFTRKRCGNDPYTDHYSRYFEDDPDFFPNFGSFPGRRRTAPQENSPSAGNSFFDHIPAEFRHYIPDGFGFSHRNAPQSPKTTQPSHPQQYYEAYVQPGSPTTAQPPQQKPKLCDAAIQTEDLNQGSGETKEGQDLSQHGLRNTVDLGQKSPPEECRGPRSQSAPPPDADENSTSQASASTSVPSEGFASANAYAYHNAAPSQAYEQPRTFAQQRSQGTEPKSPPQPPPRQHFQQNQYQQPQSHQTYYEQPQTQQQTDSQTSPGYVRTVPIFVEGRSEPIINKTTIPQQQQAQTPRQSQAGQQQVPRQPQSQQKAGHPTPLNTKQQIPPENATQLPPQTPNTTESINKIQAIQRDVLNLMMKVEHFKGIRGDKEYMYLDEMLTRNLLKLDTIDTNGKESIRLARKEAIKCIQASITVLEAKAEENARTAQQSVIDTTQAPIPISAPSTESNATPNVIPAPAPVSAPKTEAELSVEGEGETKTEETSNKFKDDDEIPSKADQNIAIPLPPPEGLQSNAQTDKLTIVENENETLKGSDLVQENKPVERTEINIQIGPNEPIQIENTETQQVEDSESLKNASMEEDYKETKGESTKTSTTPPSEETQQKADKSEIVKSKQKPEDGNDSEGGKTTGSGTVKKKIIKKKKVVPKDVGKSESPTPPAEKSSEDSSKKLIESSEQTATNSIKS